MKEKKGAPYAVYHVSTAASAAIADANATPRHVASCANTTTSPLFVAAISYKDGRDEDFLYVCVVPRTSRRATLGNKLCSVTHRPERLQE